MMEQPVEVSADVCDLEVEVEVEAAAKLQNGVESDTAKATSKATGSMATTSHKLASVNHGESSVEHLARKIEERRSNRIAIPFKMRKFFLQTCRDIANAEGYVNKMSVTALRELHGAYQKKVQAKETALSTTANETGRMIGVWDTERTMFELLDAAVKNCDELDSAWFFFRDFSFYNTVLEKQIKFFGNPLLTACVILFAFYLGSAILFCPIMKDEIACPDGESSYDGWLTAVYFASVTMSTVGYGDVNLSGGERWRTFIGSIYMLVAMAIAYTVFSTAADAALSAAQIDGGDAGSFLFKPFVKNVNDPNLPLYQRIRRLTFFRAMELLIWFVVLNMLGVFVARYFVNRYEFEGKDDWSWMTTFYWAIQTTTTIGYGDLDMPFDMRWFQIFFTTFGTAFVGAVFGAFAGLKDEVSNIRSFYAWKRREISKQMIDEMQGTDADDVVDQYEFVVASLLMLNKVSSDDIGQIMDKYRELSGEKGFIRLGDVQHQADLKVGEQPTDAAIESENEQMQLDTADK